MLTFSREAARSLRDAILPGLRAGARLWVSTFHSFCLKLLASEQPERLRLLQPLAALPILEHIAAAGAWHWYRGPLAARLNFGDHFPAAATYPVEENFRCPAPVLAVGPLRAGGGGGTRWPPRPWPCCG